MSVEVTAYGIHPHIKALAESSLSDVPAIRESLYLGESWVWDGLRSLAESHPQLLRYNQSEGGVEQLLVLHPQNLVAHFREHTEFYRTDGTWWEDLVEALVRYPQLVWVIVGR